MIVHGATRFEEELLVADLPVERVSRARAVDRGKRVGVEDISVVDRVDGERAGGQPANDER